MAGAAEWIHMGWGMGVSPEAGGGCRRQRRNAENERETREEEP